MSDKVLHYTETNDGVEIFIERVGAKEFRISAYSDEDLLDLEYESTEVKAQATMCKQVAKFGGGSVPW